MEGWSHINQGDLRVAFFTQRACGVLKVSPAFLESFPLQIETWKQGKSLSYSEIGEFWG